MAINLCDDKIGTRIEADQICSDGYDVENLISTSTRRQQGFMAEYFIKPPVNVVITFPVPTELGWICVGLVRGPVRLTGLELWVSHTHQGEADFELLARKYDPAQDVVWFRNRRYVPRGPFVELNDPLDKKDAQSEAAEPLKAFHCKFVRRLKLRLIRVQGSTSVGLGFCQVWGQPMGNSCDIAFQKELLRKSLAVPRATQLPPATVSLESKPSTSRGISTGSDPFTGVAFSEDARPTSLTELKTRIDHFVIKNLDRLANVPRTLGRGSAESGVKTASATMKCIETKPTGMLLGRLRPSQLDEEARRKASKRKFDSPPNDVVVERVAPSLARRPKNEVDHATHEERLAQSLSDSLAETLGQIRKRSSVAPSHKVDVLCSACRKSDATHGIPCGHRY
ncbi:hypothetical protein HPB47_019463 [Ixodes persulcatus]|uniref:Uncharacterized protein n=1 Tax=Ixodes persulcatus TaxID=34615 RepID=A0AC60QI38_IXOPE|nr:hypothetical protein HPB47_019463 [Ixodes persulcatus]